MTLPAPTQMVLQSDTFWSPIVKGIKLDPQNPLRIEFLIDSGSSKEVARDDAAKLVRYFLAGLTVPEKDLWVNLSAFEKDRVMDDTVASTDVGRDMLGEDYLLKQLTASITHPDTELGKTYWASVAVVFSVKPFLDSTVYRSLT
jgi:hypothetical protein